MNSKVKINGEGLGVKLRAGTILSAFLATTVVVGAVAPAYAAIDNTATVTGFAPDQDPLVDTPAVSETDNESVTVEAADPEFVLTKSTTGPTSVGGTNGSIVDVGDTITYSFTIENTGNMTLQPGAVPISDDAPTFNGVAGTSVAGLSTPTLVAATDTGTAGELSPGEIWTYTATYTLTQADIDNGAGAAGSDLVDNTVTAASFETTETTPVAAVWDPDGTDPDTADSSPTEETTIPSVPSLTLAKVAGTGTDLGGSSTFVANDGSVTAYAAGDTITYQFTVANDGNVTISNINIDDTTAFTGTGTLSSITCDTQTNGSITLAPGASEVCEATYTVLEADL